MTGEHGGRLKFDDDDTVSVLCLRVCVYICVCVCVCVCVLMCPSVQMFK